MFPSYEDNKFKFFMECWRKSEWIYARTKNDSGTTSNPATINTFSTTKNHQPSFDRG
jgi:hypothetical protein